MTASCFCGWALVLLGGVAAPTRALVAQGDSDAVTANAKTGAAGDANIPFPQPTRCLANVASASMHRVPVFLSARIMNVADSAFSPQADLLAQDVAAALRLELGGNDSTVTNGDGQLAWNSVPTSIVITAHKNGEMSAHQLVIDGDSAGARLLLRSFDAARAQGGAALMWPDQFATDSVYARLDLWPSYAHTNSQLWSVVLSGHRFPVFTLMEPEEDGALPLRNTPPPRYPPRNERTRYAGSILMQFTVDTAGRTVPGTIHDLWPKGKARLEGDDAQAYDAFVNTLTAWLGTVRFQPAHLGSCVNSQQVQWPFEFKMPGRI